MNKMILNTAFLLIFKQRSTAESIYCCQIFRQHFGRFFCLLNSLSFGGPLKYARFTCTAWSLLTSAVRGEQQDKRFAFKFWFKNELKANEKPVNQKTNELFTCNFRKCCSKVISFFWSLIKKSEWQDNARNRFHRRDLNASLFSVGPAPFSHLEFCLMFFFKTILLSRALLFPFMLLLMYDG